MGGTRINYEKTNRKKRTYEDKVKYDPSGLGRGGKILALRLIKKTFDSSKPLFQWTNTELYCLGLAIRKEWRRRINPNTYTNGYRDDKEPGVKDSTRHPSYTGGFLKHDFKK